MKSVRISSDILDMVPCICVLNWIKKREIERPGFPVRRPVFPGRPALLLLVLHLLKIHIFLFLGL